jgi:hypothetical protein
MKIRNPIIRNIANSILINKNDWLSKSTVYMKDKSIKLVNLSQPIIDILKKHPEFNSIKSISLG